MKKAVILFGIMALGTITCATIASGAGLKGVERAHRAIGWGIGHGEVSE